MEEQKINKKITIGVVAVLLIVLITIGATYAYFSAQGTTGTQTVTTGTLTMGFDKIGSVVTINGITPINDNEIKTKAAAFPFSITNTGTAHMNITIKLKDIVIADDLKDVDFRWGLYNADTDKGISFGIFKYATNGGEEIIYRDSIIDAGAPTKNYILRIWIHDDGDNQNYMQGETFSAKIDVTGVAVEYTPESCFTFNESTGTISSYSSSCPKDVIIPKTINNIAVTEIGNEDSSVFGDNEHKINSIVIPDTVTTLGSRALLYSGVQNVTIPESVTTVGLFALGNHELNNLFIPETTSSWGDYPFEEGIILPSNTLIIPGAKSLPMGLNFASINNIILMEGLTAIEYSTLTSTQITSIEIPSSVTSIPTYSFMNSSLTEIIVRGKTRGFEDDWNCRRVDFELGGCIEYIPVTYRP